MLANFSANFCRYRGVSSFFFLFIYAAGAEPSPLLLRPFIGLLFQPWMKDGDDCIAISGTNEWQGKPKYSEKTWSITALSTAGPTRLALDSNPGGRGRKLGTTKSGFLSNCIDSVSLPLYLGSGVILQFHHQFIILPINSRTRGNVGVIENVSDCIYQNTSLVSLDVSVHLLIQCSKY
jgi:hypothetical protein